MTDFQNIPTELQERDQWLLWDASADTPRRPHWKGDFRVSWSDPETWHSFAEAVAAAQKNDDWGIGYVTAAENDDYARGHYSVLDLDGVADESGGLKDWVPSIQPFFDHDVYQERSPSETGIHIPVIGLDLPNWWADCQIDDHEGVDVLQNKFCTFTGDELANVGDSVAEGNEWIVEWLREAYKSINGEDPIESDVEPGDENADPREYADDEWLTEDVAEDALDHIDPDVGYDKWKDIGMALCNHFGKTSGKTLFESWSRRGSKWDRDAEKQAQRIANDAGDYNYDAGTIVYYATQNGWDASSAARQKYQTADGSSSTVATPPSSVDNDEGATTDGGATVEDNTEGSTESAEQPTKPSPYEDWEEIRSMFRESENAEERAVPRFESAMKLHQQRSFANLEENETLYVYDSSRGVYNDNGKQVIRQQLTEGLEEQYRGHAMSEITDHIRGRNTISQDEMGGPEGKIAAHNCVIDLKAEETLDHSPEFMFQSRLGAEFDPSAECPQWRAFLDDAVPSDTQRRKLQEFVGYCLHHWSLPYHKALFLVGPTASGKSTFLDTVNELLGEGTVASLTPQQLTSERFGPAELFGKWANIRNDIPKSTVKNTGMFKELIAGDPMKAERKNKDPFFFNPTAKHLFSANQLPEMETDDEAFFRRILLVPFPETVPKPERDKHLDDKLRDELPGILNWAVEGLQRLLGAGAFTGDRSPAHTRETWSKWGDSVSRFASDAIQEGDKDVPKDLVYAAYLQYCRDESIPTDTQHAMTRQLKQEGFQDGRAYVDGSQERCFHNVAWTGRGQELLEAAKSEGDRDDSGSASGLSSFN